MKTLIIYFSATGNTKYGVDLIKFGIEQYEGNTCHCIDVKNFSSHMVGEYDLVGLACPVFAYKPPLNILEMIHKLPDGHQKPCFAFITHAGRPSNTFWILKTHLEMRNYVYLAGQDMLAQGSWTTERSPGKINYEHEPSAETQNRVIEFGRHLPAIFDRYQKDGFVHGALRFHFGILHIISYFYNDFVLRHLFTTKINTNKCTGCGRCVKFCPTGRMNSDQFPNPKGKCVGCYQCINLCPGNAIEGWLTRGKVRYRGLSPAIKILNNGNEFRESELGRNAELAEYYESIDYRSVVRTD